MLLLRAKLWLCGKVWPHNRNAYALHQLVWDPVLFVAFEQWTYYLVCDRCGRIFREETRTHE